MSGFAVVTGQSASSDVESMMDRMRHRGPDHAGRRQVGPFAMAQNYLGADIGGPLENTPLPLAIGDVTLCYDGQIANWPERATQFGVSGGPLRDERLILKMYEKDGADLFKHLDDAIFAFAISDGNRLLVARDLLGMKTLFYARKGDTLMFASELKALAGLAEEVHEFPPGHFMDEKGALTPFAELPTEAPPTRTDDVDTMCRDIREIVQRKIDTLVDFSRPTAGLLSGGMDSSVINLLATQKLRKEQGDDARLRTYAIGVGESSDIHNARIMAKHIGSDHREMLIEPEQLVEVLPQVVYHLENFDPSLVRSAASNYLISRQAHRDGYEVVLSGEGGDEVFCGYTYLKEFPSDKLVEKQVECLAYLHHNAAHRLDRMNACHSVRVVAPLVSGELLDYAMTVPPQYKQHPEEGGKVEKWIFRKAYEELLPEAITWRLKQEFSQGSGSADFLPNYFEKQVTDGDYEDLKRRHPLIRSKEEAYYFKIFIDNFGEGTAVESVGQWVSL